MTTQTKSSLPRKLVVVVGATGGQGGSVIKRLLSDGSYQLRGTTRNPQSKGSQDLIAKGVEMVTADLNDFESVAAAFEGANVIFAVTNFFETFPTSGPEVATQVEYAQGVNMARAASATTTLEHFIWSTLPDRNATTNGKFKVPHCDSKAQVDIFIKKDKALLAKTTFLWVGLFAATQQYPLFAPLPVPAAGKHVWLMPCHASTQACVIGDHTINVGHFVRAIIEQPKLTLSGRYVFATSETVTMGEWLEIWGTITGNKTQYLQISLEEFDQLWPMWGKEVGSDLKCWEAFGVDSWGPEKWIGKEELGLGRELVGLHDSLNAIVGTAAN